MMFRNMALAKLKSPEQLDESLKMITRKNLLAICTIIGLVLFAISWGVMGHIPETGRGQGVLVTPNSVVPLQTRASGQILQWFVTVGDFVEEGQVLGILAQPAIEQELEYNIDKLAEVEERNRVIGELKGRFMALERKSLDRKRRTFSSRISHLQDYIRKTMSLAETLQKKNMGLLDMQRKITIASREAAVKIKEETEKRLESYKRLRKEHLMSQDSVRNIRLNYEDAKLKIRDLDLQIQQLDLKKLQLMETYLNTQDLLATRENNLTSLKLQMRELDNTGAQLNKSESEFKFRQENESKEIQRTIERSRKQLSIDREIKSEYSGRVLEVTEAEGQLVNQGQRLIQIDTRRESDELVALAYFQAKEGKQLHKGMRVRVSPSTVSKEQYGSIIGYVENISDYPVTSEAVVNYVGNFAVAQNLISGNHTIEVLVRLEHSDETPSGYQWTSVTGPDVQITAGTLSEVWATMEQRPPISFILPKLREWTGI